MFRKKLFPPVIIYVFLTLLLLFLLGLTGILKPLRSFFEKRTIIPIRQKVYDWQRSLKKTGVDCNVENENIINQLKSEIFTLKEENKSKTKLLSSPLPKNWQFLDVKVIGLENETLFINKGSEDLVREGQVVIKDNLYLGKVTDIFPSMAKIKLPTYLDEKLMVKIIDETNGELLGRGLLTGKGLSLAGIQQILTTENVKKGNLVIAEVMDGDLLVGKVGDVLIQKDETFKTATVERMFNPESLETVFIIRGRI